VNPSLIRFSKVLVSFLFTMHLISCVFWYLLEFTTDLEELTANNGGGGAEVDLKSWGTLRIENMDTFWEKYLFAFSWSLGTSIGNDYQPDENLQRLYSALICLLGLLIYSIFVGGLSSVMMELNYTASMRKRQIDDINFYMNFHKIPKDLQKSVRRHFEFQWSQGIGLTDDNLFQSLSHKMQSKMLMSVRAPFVKVSNCVFDFTSASYCYACHVVSYFE
jgi:hypothetical protein